MKTLCFLIIVVILAGCRTKQEAKQEINASILRMDEISDDISGNYAVYITEKEWNEFVKDHPAEEFNEKIDVPAESYIVIPAGPALGNDGFVIFPPKCPNVCERNYNQEFPLGRCDCPDDINIADPSADTTGLSACFLIRKGGNALCRGVCSHGNNCSLRRIRVLELRDDLIREWRETINEIKDREIVFKKEFYLLYCRCS